MRRERGNAFGIAWIVAIWLGDFVAAEEASERILLAEERGDTIVVRREGAEKPLLVQNARKDFRPYIHPIIAPDGVGELTELRGDDAPHQTGLYWGFTRANGRDYFHHPEGDYWRFKQKTVTQARGKRVWWSVEYDLLDKDGEAIFTETQLWSCVDGGDQIILDLKWTGYAHADVIFSEYDYGGLFLRMPRNADNLGAAINSEGQKNEEEAEGQRARWVDVGVPIEGRSDWGHIAIIDYSYNTEHPTPWRVDGELGVGPCKARLGEWDLGAEHYVSEKYRFVVYTGEFSPERVETAWGQIAGNLEMSELERGIHYNLPPQEAAAVMELPDGFKLSLFAGEPDVRQPNAFCIDSRGRLWVGENYSYSGVGESPAADIRGFQPDERDRLLIFEDSDGKGRFDKRKVFTNDIVYVSGLAVGYGGVWVGSPPNLLFIPDRDGDDVPDGEPEVLLDGWGRQDEHATLNTFTWGPDGWLYGCQGIYTHSKVGKPGTPEEGRVPLNAGVWRYHPVKKEFEIFAWGTSNPWGIVFNEDGQLVITACVIPHLWHIIQGGRYQRQTGEHFSRYVFDDIKTIADHSHNNFMRRRGGHAHGGAIHYQGTSFPDAYRGKLFTFNLHHRVLYTELLDRKGSGLVGSHGGDFLTANDPWFIGFSLEEGPHGSVFFIDWYDEFICHGYSPEGKNTGRIYRMSYGDSKHGAVDLYQLGDVELANLQLDRSGWKVRHASRILAERAASGKDLSLAHERLQEMMGARTDPRERLRALWALHGSGGTNATLLTQLLDHESEYLRAWAIQLELEDREANETALSKYAEMAREDSSAVVRLYLASALQRLPTTKRWDIAEGLLGHAEDGEDQNLPLLYWYGVEPLVPADKARALRLAAKCKIPLVRRYIARRATAQ